MKIEIKSILGSVLFEYDVENNSVRKALVEAVSKKAYLQGAYLQGADLQGADLQGAYLRGADLKEYKIKSAQVFTGLYKYVTIPFITEEGEKRICLGCFNRSLKEWEADFWNNVSEFPNDDNYESVSRVFAFDTAKKWLEIEEARLTQVVTEKA